MKKSKIIIFIFLIIMSITYSCNRQGSDYEKSRDTLETQVDTTKTGTNDINGEGTDEPGINIWTAILLIILSLAFAAGTFYVFKEWIPLILWYRARMSGVRVGWGRLIKMFWRGIPQEKILNILIIAKNAKLELETKELEDAYLAEADIEKLVNALVEGRNANLDIVFEQLAQQAFAKVDIDKLLEALIIAKSAEIETNIDELSVLYHSKVDIVRVVLAKKSAKNSGFPVLFKDLSEHALAGGDIEKTVEAYIAAKKANLPNFEFEDISSIDLAGYDVLEAIHQAVDPFVVETDKVRGIARDGVELTMRLKVTLRAFIKNIIGGADEKTVLARINEGIATEIGLSETHYQVLQSPFKLADKVEQKGLQERSAFEIISVDVSDIQVGKDVHSELKSERAHAEADRARAELIKAEEKVKKAMAAAFLDGKLTIEQYKEFENTDADTSMRTKLGNSVEKDSEKEEHKHKRDDDGH